MNRLAAESSPYLRQHASNPVDWWPWGAEAAAAAAERDVPVLLSIGYSACHWCHVMAHESFEDDAIAAVMNEQFVNVKVDREERPDVDAVYMDAVQALTGRGGWPMTVFLTPDGRPFYGGTYFPPRARGGMPGFVDLLHAVTDAWANRRDELLEQANTLTDALGRAGSLDPARALPGVEVLDQAADRFRELHDDEWGGFGTAPKFPTPQNLDFLLRILARRRPGDPHAVDAGRTESEMIETSLDAMASGGMYDHLGGGFARYSVDPHWVVPHFEKMLYDQAGLVKLYVHAWHVTRHDRYRQVVTETVEYVLRDLGQAEGGFSSAEDADSLDADGTMTEGAFYVFSPDEVRSILSDTGLADATIEHWEFDRPPNFDGAWIPARTTHRGDWARSPDLDLARRLLFDARARRPRPGLDDKVLTEWNAQWISALVEAATAFDRDDWLEAAVTGADFLFDALRRADGRWLRSWQSTTGARTLAFAGDHAAVVDACTRLAEATGQARWIARALETADALIELFWDDDRGGFFTTGADGERLVARDKDLQDNTLPSANSTAALALLRLGALTGRSDLRERAEAVARLGGRLATEAPTGFGVLLAVMDLLHGGTTEIVVTGSRPDLVGTVRAAWRPNAVLAWGERYDSPLWAERADGRAYVCHDYVCSLPATTTSELEAQLSG